MWERAWESACPKEWGCRKKAQDLAQSYKINGSTNGFENGYIVSFKVKFYNCEKRIGWFDSGVEKLAAQNVASQGPVHDCILLSPSLFSFLTRPALASLSSGRLNPVSRLKSLSTTYCPLQATPHATSFACRHVPLPFSMTGRKLYSGQQVT